MSSLLAHSALVAEAWLASLPGFSYDMVARELPEDQTKWAANGFIQYQVRGGNADLNSQQEAPVILVDTWACNPGKSRPKWYLASELAQRIRLGVNNENAAHATLTLRNGDPDYPHVMLKGAKVIMLPREIMGDPRNFAHWQIQVQIWWAPVLGT